MKMNAEIWGPPFWFILHSISFSYPHFPSNSIKKKYYDFIKNLPQFIPDQKIGNQFNDFLDKYPVTPYLDNRDAFIKWMHFIHNRINEYLNKDILSYYDFIKKYEKIYEENTLKKTRDSLIKKYLIYLITIIVLIWFSYLLYRN